MTKPVNIAAIEEETQRPWSEWLSYLESINAKDLPHKEIAERVYERLEAEGGNGGWWAQSITVAYEQHIGRRQPGQRSDGSYEVSVSKVMNGSMDDAMRAWQTAVKGKTEFSKVTISRPPTTTQTDKRRHWACSLADGTRVNADVYPKIAEKVSLSIVHTKLQSAADADRWRTYWKSVLADL